MRNKVIVVGSVNMDIVVDAQRMPQLGETISGEAVHYFLGGKGANQAVACARWGSSDHEVHFFGSVGMDAFGKSATEQLKKESLQLHLQEEKNTQTGIAAIQHIGTDNCIIVVPGANECVTLTNEIEQLLNPGDVLLVQLEIPMKTVHALLKLAKEKGVITIVNPAPYHAEILEALEWIDYLTPNETEFTQMIGKKEVLKNLTPSIVEFHETYHTAIIVTEGEKGVSWCTDEGFQKMDAPVVQAVDTTGAGDTFNGVFASEIAQGTYITAAVRKAMQAASYSVTKLGAQSGMPTKQELRQPL